MIILGDELIAYEQPVHIQTVEEIKKSKPNCLLAFEYNKALLAHCNQNELAYAVVIGSIKEAIYANALNATFIITPKSLASKVQSLADHYMYDAKILALIEDEKEYEELALLGIDGVIFKKVLQ